MAGRMSANARLLIALVDTNHSSPAAKIEGRLELLIQATLSYGPRQTKKAGTGSGFLARYFLRLRAASAASASKLRVLVAGSGTRYR